MTRQRNGLVRPARGSVPARASGEAGFTLTELLVVLVIVVLTMGITTGALVSTQRNYSAQRQRLETAHEARAAVEMMARLIRMSGNNPYGIAMTPLNPDPDGNNAWDSIRVQADWNPADGAIDDAYEDVTFTAAGGSLMKQEPGDASPVLFAENVAGVLFAYRDTNDNAIANPVAGVGAIAFVSFRLTTLNTALVQDGPPLVVPTSVAVRRRE